MTASLRPVGGSARELLGLLSSWVHEGGAPVVVRTSGSTGAPKDVVLSHAAVLASARATERRLGGPGRWLLALPTSGVAGLQVLVRSVLAGTDPVARWRDLTRERMPVYRDLARWRVDSGLGSPVAVARRITALLTRDLLPDSEEETL